MPKARDVNSNPATPFPAMSRAFVDQDDIDAVVEALRGARLSDGPCVRVFEEALRKQSGASQAIATSSGSAARHALYHALGVGVGRCVLTSASAPASTALSAQISGGEVEFIDIDAHTANINVTQLERRLAEGPIPHVVTLVHSGGLPCDMEWILALRKRYDFELVEDGAYAFGARYRVEGRWYRIGEHPDVRAAILSFNSEQQITTGEGGAILTSDTALAEKLRRLRSHGMDSSLDVHAIEEPGGPSELGFNYRMSELQAALGTSQLKKLPEFIAARREIAMRYMDELVDFEFLNAGGLDREHAYGRFVIRTHGSEREALLYFLRERGVWTEPVDFALPQAPWFRARTGGSSFPVAEAHALRALALPICPALSESEQARVIHGLCEWRALARRAG